MQKTNRPLSGADDGGLYQSRSTLMVRGQPQGRVLSRSLYTKATEHRGTVALAVVGIAAVALVAALLPRRRAPYAALRPSRLVSALPSSAALAKRLPRAAAAAFKPLRRAMAPRRHGITALRPRWL